LNTQDNVYKTAKNNEKHKQKYNFRRIIISVIAVCVIAVSILFFALSINKTYIGATFSLTDEGWIVQNIDPSGIAGQEGINVGDKPIKINGQTAEDFFKDFKEEGQCVGLSVTDLTVISNNNQTISVTTEGRTPSSQLLAETSSFFLFCLIFWLTSYYVFHKKPDNKAAILLLLCSLAFGLAISGNAALLRLFPMASHLAVISTVLGPWLLLHFFLVLPEENARLRNNSLLYLIYLPALITLILYPFLGYANGEPILFFRTIRMFEMGAGFLAVIGVVIYNYFSAVSPRTRQQMKLLLFFCILAVAPLLIFNTLPSIITGDILIPSTFSIIFLSLIPIGMGYVVVTQKLLDITVIIRRGVVYGAISVVIASIFSIAIVIMFFYVKNLTILQGIAIALLLGILASLLFGPVKTGIEFLVDKFFYKDKYDYRKVLQELGASLNSITDIVTGSTLVVNTLADRINLDGACLFTTTEGWKFEIVAASGIYTEAEQQKQLVELLSDRNSSIEFPNSSIIVNPNVEFLIPLVASDKEIGGICLSPKSTKQRYSSDDLFLIQGLAPVVAVSLRSWIIIAMDIAERKRTEEKLRNAAEEWRITFDSIPTPVSLQSKDFKILRINKAYADLFNVNPEDIIGKTCYELVHKMDKPIAECPHIKMLEAQDSSVVEIHDAELDKFLEITVSPIMNSQNEIVASIHIIRDITQVKKAEEEKRQLQEKAEISSRLASVGEMAAGIAHEINNPLTGVIGFSDMLLERDLPPDMKEQVEIIADGSRRVADIVKRLLTFARQHKPVKAMVDINALIDNTLNMRNYVLKTNNISVNTNYDLNLPLITVDPGQIQQVFLNLIINAEYSMKKTGKPGNLTVTTKKVGDKVQISFADNGTGISHENKKRLFQPFFTTKPVGEGTGLGLSLSRSIITEHKGTINVESESGKGATFIIELPVIKDEVQSEAIETEPISKTESNIKQTNILVVDDEPAIQQFVKSTLDISKYTVDTTGDPQDALKKIAGRNYDLVIIDIRMSGMNGLELYDKIVSDKPFMSTKILFTTGDAENIEVKEFFHRNNLPFIRKPFDHKIIEKKIREMLRF
jgi:PAS domain S-box-containing protein